HIDNESVNLPRLRRLPPSDSAPLPSNYPCGTGRIPDHGGQRHCWDRFSGPAEIRSSPGRCNRTRGGGGQHRSKQHHYRTTDAMCKNSQEVRLARVSRTSCLFRNSSREELCQTERGSCRTRAESRPG